MLKAKEVSLRRVEVSVHGSRANVEGQRKIETNVVESNFVERIVLRLRELRHPSQFVESSPILTALYEKHISHNQKPACCLNTPDAADAFQTGGFYRYCIKCFNNKNRSLLTKMISNDVIRFSMYSAIPTTGCRFMI